MLCESRPIKARRSRSEMGGLKAALYAIAQEAQPATVRQIYYQATAAGLIPKTEAAYKSIVVRLLTEMRKSGDLPFEWIADNTRWMRKPTTHTGLHRMLWESAQLYRRDLWENQRAYVEIWLEKDALAGVLYDVTEEFDVPLMVCRGYSSISFLKGAADTIGAVGKPAWLYYLGDHDPSGLNISATVERDLRRMAPGAEIHFERVAVTREQIETLNLPTRPTKTTDSRSKGFIGESVELDSIHPEILRKMARRLIERHIDQGELHRLRVVEQQERETLSRIAEAMENFQ